MKSILHDFYYGRVIPWERRNPYAEEQREINRKIESEERYFVGKMSLDDCKRFEAFKNLLSQAYSMDEVDIFSHGFKLGALFMLEVFADENNPLHGENEADT